MRRLRFYIGKFWLELGLWIMPFDALASFSYNTRFLSPEAEYQWPENGEGW